MDMNITKNMKKKRDTCSNVCSVKLQVKSRCFIFSTKQDWVWEIDPSSKTRVLMAIAFDRVIGLLGLFLLANIFSIIG